MLSNVSSNVDELNEIDSESADKIDPIVDRMAKSYSSSLDLLTKYSRGDNSPLSYIIEDAVGSNIDFRSSVQAVILNSGIPDIRHKTHIKNRFQCKKKLTGYIKEVLDNGSYVSVLEDGNGQKFIYDFQKEALPVQQRTKVEEGGILVVLVGDQYEGTTLVKKTKVYLSPFSAKAKSRVGRKIIAEDLENWGF